MLIGGACALFSPPRIKMFVRKSSPKDEMQIQSAVYIKNHGRDLLQKVFSSFNGWLYFQK